MIETLNNFGPCSQDTAISMLQEGFILMEKNGNLTACFESISEAFYYAYGRGCNVHFPNGFYLAADYMKGATSHEDFKAVAMRQGYMEEAEALGIILIFPGC